MESYSIIDIDKEDEENWNKNVCMYFDLLRYGYCIFFYKPLLLYDIGGMNMSILHRLSTINNCLLMSYNRNGLESIFIMYKNN